MVYHGHDTRLGRPVAIKVMHLHHAEQSSSWVRFQREAQSSAGLNHSRIVALYDSGIASDGPSLVRGLPFMVMEYVVGYSLREVLRSRAHLTPAVALRLGVQVLEALSYAHRMGIVHRDIKPSNVMVELGSMFAASDDLGQIDDQTLGDAKVLDFGISRAISSQTITDSREMLGSIAYMSPERLEGMPLDLRSDLYSTSCLIYELLTGRPPFVGDSSESVMYRHFTETPQPPSRLVEGIPMPVDAVIQHALAKQPADRYQDADSMRSDILAALEGASPLMPSKGRTGRSNTSSLEALVAGWDPD